MTLIRKLLLLTILITINACSENKNAQEESSKNAGPDKIFFGGNIYTFNWPAPNGEGIPNKVAPFVSGKWQPDAEAVAVKNGIVIATGVGDIIITQLQPQGKKAMSAADFINGRADWVKPGTNLIESSSS